MRGAIVALEGPSGVGKSTIARRLALRLGARCLPEAWAGLRPRPSLRFRTRSELFALERRLLAAESRRFRRARRESRAGRPVVADTGFLGPLTYSAGLARVAHGFDVVRPLVTDAVSRLASGALGAADITVYLGASPATLRRRQAGSRPTHPDDLTRRHWRVAAIERAIWVTAGRVRVVDAEPSPERVAATITRSLPFRTLPDPAPGTPDPAVRRALEIVAGIGASGTA